MKRSIQLSILIIGVTAALGITSFVPLHVRAQTSVTSTSHASIDESPCGATVDKSCTRTNQDGSVTTCGGSLGSPGTCKVTFPDGSYTTITPGSFAGQNIQNYSSSGTVIGTNNTADSNALSPQTTGQQTDYNKTAQGTTPACTALDVPCYFMQGLMWIVRQIALLFLFLANVFLAFGGAALNWIMYVTIFQFGNIIGNNPGLLAAWRVLRDIGNIVLLFGFIFMGVSTILNLPGNEFTAKRALPTLIIFALLMNFSLFAAEAVIDVSNAFGTAIYKSAATTTCAAQDTGCISSTGIATSIVNISGISGIFKKDTLALSVTGGDLTWLMVILGLTVFCLIAAFVFFAAVVMFAIRLIVLAFVMVTSPIGFAGMAIPPLHEWAHRWWDALLKQSFFAPIFLLMILISIKFMEGVITVLGGVSGQSLADVFAAQGVSNVSIIVNFVLIIGFMIAAVMMAQSIGAVGASGARRLAGGIVFGGYSRLTNYAVGGLSHAARVGVQRATVNSTGVTRAIGIGASNVFRAGEKINIDPRQLGGSKILGEPAKAAASYADARHALHDVRKEIKANERQYDVEVKGRTLAQHAHAGTLTDEDKKLANSLPFKEWAKDGNLEHAAAEIAAYGLTNSKFNDWRKSEEFDETVKQRAVELRYQRMLNEAATQTSEQFDEQLKNEYFSDQQKDALRARRFEDLQTKVSTNAADLGTAVRALNEKELTFIANSPSQQRLFADYTFVSNITDDQYEKIKSSPNIKAEQKALLDRTREERFSTAHVTVTVQKMSPENFGKLQASTIAKKEVLDAADNEQLLKIDINKLDRTQRGDVIKHMSDLKKNDPTRFNDFDTRRSANANSPWFGVDIP